MDVRLFIAKSSLETGALLKEYLQKRGLTITEESKTPVISYGVPCTAKRVLNRLPGKGKIYNMEKMNAAGVRTVPYFSVGDYLAVSPEDGSMYELLDGIQFPLLARKVHGYGGTDIVPVFEAQEIPWRIKAGWDWFSSYVPVKDEFRVWAFRDEVLGTYKKQMNRPQDYKFIGRNFRNGFDFVKSAPDPEVSQTAVKVLKSLSYDFAAVDMLRGRDGKIYVLETNSAPGAIKSEAQPTLGLLADRMVEWAKNGCPEWKMVP